jgi:hypothetical protein
VSDDSDEDDDPAYVPRLSPIPRELHSAHDEGPFQKCSDCGASLQGSGAGHLIGKSWRDGEVVFEFALCIPCAESLFQQYSDESKQNLTAYFVPLEGVKPGGLVSCYRCGASGDALSEEKSLEAVALGDQLVEEPVLVCGPCTDGAEKVLSKKTKEAFDDFVRRVCPTVPEGVDLPAPIFSLP